MRTNKQISNRLNSISNTNEDFFGFQAEAILEFTPWENAKFQLKEEYRNDPKIQKQWEAEYVKPTKDNVLARMKEYMEFALDKAADHRGLSANRSIDKFKGWTWLIDEYDDYDWSTYENYGAPILVAICKQHGWEKLIEEHEWDLDEGGRYEPITRMAQGLQCRPDGCLDGCGR